MDAVTKCKAMEAFCRQRARMEGETAEFWLAEANVGRDRLVAVATGPKPVAKPAHASSSGRARRAGKKRKMQSSVSTAESAYRD
jgi:hypothetical protein